MPIRRQKQPMQPAKNQRLVSVARETIQHLADTARQTARAAIEASGYPVTVYSRLTHGRTCTCSRQDVSLLDEEGNLPEEQIQSLLQPKIKIKEYGSKPTANQTGVDEDGTITYDIAPKKTQAGFQSSFQNRDKLSVDLEEEDLDLAELNSDFETERLYSRGNVSCAVCYGTGYVGGFNLVSGIHQVFDVQLAHSLYNAEHLRDVSPNAIRLMPSGTVEFTATWPAGATAGLIPLLFHNKELVNPNDYLLTVNDNVVSSANILTFAIGTPVTIKIKANKEFVFTHLDTAFRVSHSYADFPSIGTMYEIDKADPATSVSIALPGDYSSPTGSIIIDHLRGVSRGWRVSSSQKVNDNYGVVRSWQAEARVLEKYELPALLRPLPFAEPQFRENRMR